MADTVPRTSIREVVIRDPLSRERMSGRGAFLQPKLGYRLDALWSGMVRGVPPFPLSRVEFHTVSLSRVERPLLLSPSLHREPDGAEAFCLDLSVHGFLIAWGGLKRHACAHA